ASLYSGSPGRIRSPRRLSASSATDPCARVVVLISSIAIAELLLLLGMRRASYGGPLNIHSKQAQSGRGPGGEPFFQLSRVLQAAGVRGAAEHVKGVVEGAAGELGVAQLDRRLGKLRRGPAAVAVQTLALGEVDTALEQPGRGLRVARLELEPAEVQRRALEARAVVGALEDRHRLLDELLPSFRVGRRDREHRHPNQRHGGLAGVARGTTQGQGL